MEPERFGSYLLLRLLARGGMGELYVAKRADAPADEPLVVVKRILPELMDDTDFAQMFLAEGDILALIDHPNVVRVHETGRAGGVYFMCMEYVAGRDLGSVLKRLGGPLDLPAALFVMHEVCEGLAFAHEVADPDGNWLRLVHRDINPNNILISYTGEVKLADFGVAKTELAGGHKTSAGVLKGKFGYLSPEQAQGRPLDRRSDIFALGLVLFELTLGRPAMTGEEPELLLLAARGHVPRPGAVRRGYPVGLERIVQRATARDPQQRFQTAREMQRALAGFQLQLGLRDAAADRTLGELVQQLFDEERDAERQELAPQIRAGLISPGALEPARGDERLQEVLEATRDDLPQAFATLDDGAEDQALRVSTADYDDPLKGLPDPTERETAERIPWPVEEDTEPGRSAPAAAAPARPVALWRAEAPALAEAPPPSALERALSDYEPGDAEDESATTIRPPVALQPPGAVKPAAAPDQPAPRAPRSSTGMLRAAAVLFVLAVAVLVYLAVAHVPSTPHAAPDVAGRPTPDARRPQRDLASPPPADSAARARTAALEALARDATVTSELFAVRVSCTPAVTVYWHGRRLGPTPLSTQLPAGRHPVLLRNRELGLETTRELVVARGRRTAASFQLGKGKLDLRVRPWAQVQIDGARRGTTPLPPIELWEGRYNVRLVNPTLKKEHRVRVVIKAGQTERLVYRFEGS